MSLPTFQLLRPKTLDEALALMARHEGEVKIVAGGTDLLPSMKQKLFTPPYVLDLRGVSELRGIRSTNSGVEIGALTTLAAIEHSPLIRKDYPVLYQAAKTVASPVLRNMGTIGGNLCLDTRCLWYNQSLLWRQSCGFCLKKDGDLCHVAPGGKFCWATFSGDTPPALLCLGAEIEIAGPAGCAAYPIVRVLRERRHCSPASRVQRDRYPRLFARVVCRLARQLPEAAGARQHRLSRWPALPWRSGCAPGAWKMRAWPSPPSILPHSW